MHRSRSQQSVNVPGRPVRARSWRQRLSGRKWRDWRPVVAFWVIVSLGVVSASAPQGTPVAALHPPTSNPITDLWNWIATPFGWVGGSGDLPGTPRQATGTAANRPHYVSAAATRAKTGSGRPPGTAVGQLPEYKPYTAKVTPHPTGHQSGAQSFDPATSTRMAGGTSAQSTVYHNADGSYTRHTYGEPVNYRAPDGSWQPISTTLSVDGSRLRNGANSFGLSLARTAVDPAVATFTAGGHSIGYGLRGAADVPASVSGSTVTYPGVLPDTDLVLASVSSGLKQTLVLRSAKAPTSWVFPLVLDGVRASVSPSTGAIEFRDDRDRVVASVPPGYMTDSKYGPKSGLPAESHAVTQKIIVDNGVPALQLSVDKSWLSSPDRVFPIRVDPTLTANEYASNSTFASKQTPGNNSGDYTLRVGTYDGGVTERTYSFLQFANFGAYYAGNQINGASLHVFDFWSFNCNAAPFSVNPVTAAWTPSGVTAYPGPTFGAAIGGLTTSPGAACTNGAGGGFHDPSVGKAMVVPLAVDTFRNWVAGSANYGLALTASQTDSTQWKLFDSVNGPNPPYLELTYSPDVAPQVDSQFPANNQATSTLTPTLLATGHDPDSWPGALQYRFTVYDINATEIANSGLISSGRWTIPANLLHWNTSYLYLAQTYDGYTYSDGPRINLISTAVPQPPVTSKLSQNSDGRGFDPRVGNYTTSTVDAQVASVGPTLAIQRSYNSFDPRRDRAFGEGWSSIVDSRATEQTDPDTAAVTLVTVTYPDGQQATFGRNPDGTFGSPPGRYANVTSVAGGGYRLIDKQSTTYTFTQTTGSPGNYGLTSVKDALGRTLTLHYTTGLLDRLTSAGGRSLAVTWQTPPGTTTPHIATVVTDPATSGAPSTALTWQYHYDGDSLTQVCPPTSSTQCTGYSYTTGSRYRPAVMDSQPYSYWPLSDATGSAAVSQQLANQGADNGTYTGVQLGQPGPLAGSAATAAAFDGTTSSVALPDSLVFGDANEAVALWFKTTNGNGVLFSYQADPITNATTAGNYTPALYIGSDGKLRGEFWQGAATPITSAAAVTDGNWHQAVLSAGDDTQTLYLDGAVVGNLAGHVLAAGQHRAYVGAGFIGGGWPTQTYSGQSPAVMRFHGSISDVASYHAPVNAATVAQQNAAGRQSARLLSSMTRPSGAVGVSISYAPVTGVVNEITDANGGDWHIGAPTVTGTSQLFTATMLGSGAEFYWRMGETGGTEGVSELPTYDTLTYDDITLGVPGMFGATDDTAAGFNGTSSAAILNAPERSAFEVWFNTTQKGSVLMSANPYAWEPPPPSDESNAPLVWIGDDGRLRIASTFIGQTIATAASVADGGWHQLAVVNNGGARTLYVDGAQVGDAGMAAFFFNSTGILGAGFVPPDAPLDGLATTGVHYFAGSMDELTIFRRPLAPEEVAAHYAAYRAASGPTPMRRVVVTDPGQHPITYDYDMRNGDRMIRKTDAVGNTTVYGYDAGGYPLSVVDPNGSITLTGHDVRGNMISQMSCQLRIFNMCSTAYFSYYPDATTSVLTPDPRNDLLLTQRDARSSSQSDNTYLTSFGYDAAGNRTSVTTPAVPGYPSGRTTTTTYSDGTTTPAVGGGFAPAGLPATSTTPGGAVTRVAYTDKGDVATVTDAAGVVTSYGYDGLGRVLTKMVTSTAHPAGLTTSFVYDRSGAVTSQTEPAVINRVTGAVHTAVTTTTYNVDGQPTGRTVADATGADAARSATVEYNPHGQVLRTTDPLGHISSYGYDAYGNANSVTTNGRETRSEFDPNGHLLTQTLTGYIGDPAHPSAAQDLVLSSNAYDPAGRLASATDSMGRLTTYEYTDNGLLTAAWRQGGPAPIMLISNWYDAVGNLLSRGSDDHKLGVQYTVDAANRTVDQETWGSGNRATTYAYSADDAVLSATQNSVAFDENWNEVFTPTGVTDYTYDVLGRMASRTDHGDSGTLSTTSWNLDQRGLATSVTDPLGHVTSYEYDEDNRLVLSSSPTVAVEADGTSPVQAHTITTVGFDTFGEQTESQDANGGVTTTGYDAAGRPLTVTMPTYTPPGTGTPITPVSQRAYDGFGQVSTSTDPLGHQTHFDYDQLGNVASVTTADGAVTRFTYDTAGDRLSATDPTGAISQATYDLMGRTITSTQVVRQPTPAAYTTTYRYDYLDPGPRGGPWLMQTTQTTPAGVSTTSMENLDSLTDYVQDNEGHRTHFDYDGAGRLIKTTQPDGTATATGYDLAGRVASRSTLDAQGATMATTSFGYDLAGQLTSTTDPLGHATTFSYDALGRLTGSVEPVSSSSNIASSFGYDAAGNLTRFTDGRNNAFRTTYNSWGLPESQIEPSTPAHPALADRTFTDSYNAAGQLTQKSLPGGVSVTNSYDVRGNLTGQVGAGAEVTTTDRSFGYDQVGRLTSATGTGGTNTFGYDDRGLLLSATGPSGTSSFAYTPDGQPSSRTDAAGTTTYGYDDLGRLNQLVDPLTGTHEQFSYDAVSQLTQIAYGQNGNVRTFGYDGAHRLTSDAVSTNLGATLGSIVYGYDAAGNETSKVTTGLAGSAENTYGYDFSSRLTSWNNGATTVQYGYDGSGNRTSAGASTFTYDARDEVTGGGGKTYAYSPRGTLASTTVGSTVESSGYDAFGQLTAKGNRTYSYDALGRMVQYLTDAGSPVNLTYSGIDNDVAADGANTYSRDPAGSLIAEKGTGSAVLAWTDQHWDVVGQFAADGSSLTGSGTYDPWGKVVSSTGLAGNLGYQSGWTDPQTSDVNMSSRWYDPEVGGFTSRDTIGVSPAGASVRGNRFAYVNDNPLGDVDPTGHCAWYDVACKASQAWHATTQAVSSAANWVADKATQAYDWAKDTVTSAWNAAVDAFDWVTDQAAHLYDKAVQVATAAVDDFKHDVAAVVRVADQAKQWAQDKVDRAQNWVSHAAVQAWNETKSLASDAAHYVEEHKTEILAAAAGIAVGVAVFSGCMALSFGAGSVGCAVIAGAAGGAVGGAIGCPAGTSRLTCAGVGALGGAVAGAIGAVVFAGAAALGAGGILAGVISGAAAGAGGDIVSQLVTTGNVNWREVGGAALLGGALGGIGGAFGGKGGAGKVPHADEPPAPGHTATDEPTAPGRPADDDQPSGGGCKTANSFLAGTAVQLADGKTRTIDTLVVGDKVEATDPATGKTEASPVVAVIVGQGEKDLVDLTFADGDAGSATGTVVATSNHPFWEPDRGVWAEAGTLAPGDRVATLAGGTATLVATHARTERTTVYNLTVAHEHTYYVLAGYAPVLVHNCGTNDDDRSGMDFTEAEKQKVYDRNADDNDGVLKCEYCNRPVTRRPSQIDGEPQPGRPDDAQIDHEIPKCDGGCGTEHNGKVACRRCNGGGIGKGTKTVEEWDAELREYLDE
jgi:RHS repeat-associated protein